jgi:hypothetical protein
MKKIYLVFFICFFINLDLIFAQNFLQKGIQINQSIEKEVFPDEIFLRVLLRETTSKKKT